MSKRLIVSVIALLLPLVGCLDSKFPIASDQPPKVDRAYVGDWVAPTEKDKPPISLVIRNWDDKEYYVEWSEREKASESPLRMRAFVVTVKGVDFAHLAKLEEDGTLADSYLIMKVALDRATDTLTLQNLDEHFFGDNPPRDGRALRATIEANLENPKLYEGEALKATRAKEDRDSAATAPASQP